VLVRSPAEAKDFSSSLCVQTSSEAHPASYPWVAGSFTGGKARPERDADNSPHLVPRSRMSMSYGSSPPWSLHGGSGTALHYFAFGRNLVSVAVIMFSYLISLKINSVNAVLYFQWYL
jgi:hypothetical protein